MNDLKPLYITNFTDGLYQGIDPNDIPQDGFTELTNAFNYRGRLRVREGHSVLGRLKRTLESQGLSNTDGSASYAENMLDELGLETATGSIVPGSVVITIGAPGSLTFTDQGNGTLSSTGSNTGTIDYATSTVNLTFSPTFAASTVDVDFEYYPGLPVMGLWNYNLPSINAQDTIAFDTTYAYEYDKSNSSWEEWIPGTEWSGDSLDYFWATNFYQDGSGNSLFWVTNNTGSTGDVLRYTDGSTWSSFAPTVDGSGNEMHQCAAMIGYKGRLVAFNTWEGANLGASVNYPNRARWSWNGAPTDQTNGWRDDISGSGGYIDAPTQEAIKNVAFVKDVLIVGFQYSTYALVYTNNEASPFLWKRVNTELGAVSSNSYTTFDKGLVGISAEGVVLSNGNSVERIDIDKIPTVVQDFAELPSASGTPEGLLRVQGARDFQNQLIYWTFVNPTNGSDYADYLLVYNYQNNTWALFQNSFTVFGYWQANSIETWSDYTDVVWNQASFIWASTEGQTTTRNLIAGNQQGWTLVLNNQYNDSESLWIRTVSTGTPATITSPDHNLHNGDIVYISGCMVSSGGSATNLNGNVFQVQVSDANTLTLYTYDADLAQWVEYTLSGSSNYIGGGVITIRANFAITSKLFNISDIGKSLSMSYIDFLAVRTDVGEVSCGIYAEYDTSDPINDGSDPFFNTYFLTTDEGLTKNAASSAVWHRFYCPVDTPYLQYSLFLDDDQIVDTDIYNSIVAFDSLILWLSPAGELV